MNYKNWMNRCTRGETGELFGSARDGVIIATGIGWAILGFVPVIGPGLSAVAGVLNVILPYLWPEDAGAPGTDAAQISWDQILRTVEGLVGTALSSVIKTVATTELRDLQEDIISYNRALCNLKTDPTNETYKTTVRREFDNAADQARKTILAMSPITPDQPDETKKNAILLLADYAQAATLHLLLLRDVIQYGESWGYSSLEVQQYYNNPSDKSGMKQRLEEYTNYCVNWYNVALSDIRASSTYMDNKWREFNAFRRDMTIMVLDIVSLWPTFDPILYRISTKSQLTRTVYTNPQGEGNTSHTDLKIGIPFDQLENSIVATPKLFSWLRKLELNHSSWANANPMAAYQMTFQNTLSNKLWEGGYIGQRDDGYDSGTQTLTIPEPQSNDDIWQITTNMNYTFGSEVEGWWYSFTQSPDQYIGYPNAYAKTISGLPCRGNNPDICEPCQSENPCSSGPLNNTDPCNDKQIYSHRFSYMGGGTDDWDHPSDALSYFCYGWTHVSADPNNLIDAEKITQIPAVKGFTTSPETRVVKGPGSTGGDLVELPNSNGVLQVRVTTPASETVFGYAIRLRYTSNMATSFGVSLVQPNSAPIDKEFTLPATTVGDNRTYEAFGYYNFPGLELETLPSTEEVSTINLFNNGGGNVIIDKIEFIPIKLSLEEYQAKQDLEKAWKAVNALFTSDAKNALKLNGTDGSVAKFSKRN